jgi:hypothetical protein
MKVKHKIISTVFCLLFVVIIFSVNSEKKSFEDVNAQWLNQVEQIDRLINNENYDEAYPLLESVLKEASHSLTILPSTLAWLYEKKAQILASRYHFHGAIKAVELARKQQPVSRHTELIGHWRQHINSMQTERNQKDSYFSGKNSGLSRTLTNKINIAYIYIDDNRSSKWSGKQRLKNQHSVAQVKSWYQQQAKQYGINELELNVRYFVVNSPKGIGKEWLRQASSFNYIVARLLKNLHFDNVDSFIKHIAGREPNSQVALVFHSNFEGRSFARACPVGMRIEQCKFEYVMLTEKMNNSQSSWALSQIQAHEVLHLFGAKDLYNITKSKDYAVTDLMNYYSKDIKYATIDPLTAWAIGWQNKPSAIPFKVEK